MRPTAILPTRAFSTDAGLDLYADIPVSLYLHNGERYLFPTGLAIEIPDGYVGKIESRSGLSAKFGIQVGAGVIDASYRGEVGVLLYNFNPPVLGSVVPHGPPEYVEIKPGQKIAQLVIYPIALPEPEEVQELSASDRGEGGFGSTDGRKP